MRLQALHAPEGPPSHVTEGTASGRRGQKWGQRAAAGVPVAACLPRAERTTESVSGQSVQQVITGIEADRVKETTLEAEFDR